MYFIFNVIDIGSKSNSKLSGFFMIHEQYSKYLYYGKQNTLST